MRARLSMFVFLAALLAACARPVPPEKSAYVGHWKSPTMSLSITQAGRVEYRRTRGSVNTSIKGPLQGFDGDNFTVGIAMLKTTFVVSTPPHEDRGRWKMVVDGVEVTRVE